MNCKTVFDINHDANVLPFEQYVYWLRNVLAMFKSLHYYSVNIQKCLSFLILCPHTRMFQSIESDIECEEDFSQRVPLN